MRLLYTNFAGFAVLSALLCNANAAIVAADLETYNNSHDAHSTTTASSINASMTPVVSAEGLTSVTSASVDRTQGTSAVSASISLPTALPATISNLQLQSYGRATLGGVTTLQALTGSTAAIPVTFTWDIHGAFSGIVSTPGLALSGTLDVLIGNALHEEDQSGITLAQPAGTFDSFDFAVGTIGTQQLAGQSLNNSFSGASQVNINEDPTNLTSTLEITTMVAPGDSIRISGLIQALVSPSVDQINSLLTPSSGTVDALHTGRLGVILPQGYTLDSSGAPLFANIVTYTSVTSAVPEPGTWALFAVGLGAVFAFSRRVVIATKATPA